MAEGGSSRPPMSVTFDDDKPRSGYFKLSLEIPGLKVKKPLMGSAKPVNATAINAEITKSQINIKLTIDGKETYEYKKDLPEEIESGKVKYEKAMVVLELLKSEKVSWVPHRKYLMASS